MVIQPESQKLYPTLAFKLRVNSVHFSGAEKMNPSTSNNTESRSSCELLRQTGNNLYMEVSKGILNLGPSVARHKLQKAHEFYEKALGVSGTEDDKASCYKNLGALNWLWGKTEWIYHQEEIAGKQKQGPGSALSAAKSGMTRCLEFYFNALDYGSLAMKEQQWLTQIEDTISIIVQWSSDQLYGDHCTSFEPVLRVLCETVESSKTEWAGRRRMGAMLYKIHAQFIFRRGLESLTNTKLSDRDGFKKCLNAMHDCYGPLERAETLVGAASMGKEVLKQVADLKTEVSNYQTLCEAIQARIQGEELLEKAMCGDMDIIWEAIDYLKASLRVTEEKNLENEAIALNRLGKSYSSVLKMEKKAHPYHFQSIKIALAIMSARIASSEWYISSFEAVRKHQEGVVEQEAREHAENRKGSAERMKEKISAVKSEGGKSAESLLKYIYEKCPHPDVTKQVLLPFGSPENVKAALKKAIVAYHPDSNRQQSEDWQVLCEEITKVLIAKYEIFK